MKVVQKVEIEYVVPETQQEREELEALIAAVHSEDGEPFDPSDLRRVEPKVGLRSGYWRG